MKTTEKGDIFEDKAFQILDNAIKNGELGLMAECCKLFKKKGYYSEKRKGEIIFDLSIEVWLPNAEIYTLLYLIECKSYSSRIPVNDVEEFYSKILQVSGVNVKGVFVADNKLQEGAFNYLKAQGMMLINVHDNTYNIVLHKEEKISAEAIEGNVESLNWIEELENIIYSQISNAFAPTPQEMKVQGFNFFSTKQIEKIATDLLNEFNPHIIADAEKINMDNLIEFIKHKLNIEVNLSDYLMRKDDGKGARVLGKWDRQDKTIYINKAIVDENRYAFVLAHEIGHRILHGDFVMNQQDYEQFEDSEYDFFLGKYQLKNMKNWIEWQANTFAASFLMPEKALKLQLIKYQQHLGISKTGRIYYDSQLINRQDFKKIVLYLSSFFNVGNASIIYRLNHFGIIQTPNKAASIAQLMNNIQI